MSQSQGSADDRHEPQVNQPIIRCPRCKVRAQQRWGTLNWIPPKANWERFFDEAHANLPLDQEEPDFSTWRVAHCQGCDEKTLWRDNENVYPVTSAVSAPHPQMTPEVKPLYEEAARVLPLSRRASAALVRAALEKQIRALDTDAPKNSRLDERIARLSSRVSTPLAELLDVIRHLGNASLHGSGDDELVYLYLDQHGGDADIVEMLFDAINNLVDELITRPAATKTLWDKLPVGVRETIERKRQDAAKG